MNTFIRKRRLTDGNLRYYPIVVVNGEQHALGGFDSKRSAEARLKRAVMEYASGIKEKDITFGKYSETWLEHAKTRVKPRVYSGYAALVHQHLSVFNKQPLNAIDPADIKRLVTTKAKTHSVSTVNHILGILKTILESAVEDRYISFNPAGSIKPLKRDQKEMKYFTLPEIERFLEATPEKYYPLFATAILTGLRQGELLALRWTDVDLNNSVITVRETYHPKQGFTRPKTKNAKRAVIISPTLVEILSALRSAEDNDDDLVFRTEEGTPIDRDNLHKRVYVPTLKKAKLKYIRFHDLRHTYVALMISLGESPKFIQTQLGHGSIVTSLDTYGHLMPEVPKGFGERLDSLIFDSKIQAIKTGTGDV